MVTRLQCPSCRKLFKEPKIWPLYCRCGAVVEQHEAQPQTPKQISGPGTELTVIMGEFGIKEKPSCSCRSVAAKMDAWGIEGCEQNRDWIVRQIEANAKKWSWLETLQIAASNVTNPLALSIAFRGNIYHALLDEAIARAKQAYPDQKT